MHCLIVGPRGVGKSTLIRRVLAELGRPVCGFETKKEDSLADAALGSPVHLYPVGEPKVPRADNRICHCPGHDPRLARAAFDRYAPRLLAPAPPGGVMLMDELGFLESRSDAFCQAVLRRLEGDVPVIAAVKDLDIPFLTRLRSHPNCRCFFITPENRDGLFGEVLEFMEQQVRRAGHAPAPPGACLLRERAGRRP